MAAAINETAYREAMNLGHSAAWDQDWDAAAKHYFKAVEASPNSFPGAYQRGFGAVQHANLCPGA